MPLLQTILPARFSAVSLSSFAVNLVDHLGLTGIGIGVGLAGLGVPGISEVMMPVAGVSIRQGHLAVVSVFVVAMIGQMIGFTIAYYIARYGGVELIERYGKYVFISRRELDHAQHWFDRYGGPLIFFGAIVPGVQGFIGYIGGLAEMSLARFLLFAFLGKAVWVGGLMYLGYLLGNHVSVIDKILSRFGLVILLLAIAGIVIWYAKQRQSKAGRPSEPASPKPRKNV